MDVAKLKSDFAVKFGRGPRIFRAPGRVNLIGEHTDYNDGFVMPFAIDRATFVAGSPRNDRKIEAVALDMNAAATIDLNGLPQKLRKSWIDYVEGTARSIEDKFGELSGANIIITSNVPIGAGLSSSAALETSVGFALLSLSSIDIDREQLAFAAQKAEHEYAGTMSGIMDQFASSFCQKGNAMLLDCRSLVRTQIPFESPDVVTVVCNTKVEHSLASSEYNKRREECEEGVRILQKHQPEVTALRDATLEMLDAHRNELGDIVYRRCRHVIRENERTVKAAECLRRHDLAEAGELMFQSHESLKDDYEVSCPELDELVEIARSVEGVFGSRMTGGGFGGCTVSLVKNENLSKFEEAIRTGYKNKFGKDPDIYQFHAADGASEVTA